jgi:hypothetical protein
METYWPPFNFKANRNIDFKHTAQGDVTRNYHFRAKGRPGKKITGTISMNWSRTVPYSWGGYRILTCNATGNFTAKPAR